MIRPANNTHKAPAAPVMKLPIAVPIKEMTMTGLRPMRSDSLPNSGRADQLGERKRGEQKTDRETRRAETLGVSPEYGHDDPEPDEVERNRCPDGPVPLGHGPALSLCHDSPFYLIGSPSQQRRGRTELKLGLAPPPSGDGGGARSEGLGGVRDSRAAAAPVGSPGEAWT